MEKSKIPDSFVRKIGNGAYSKPKEKIWIRLEKLGVISADKYNKVAIPYKRNHPTEYWQYIAWGNEGYRTIKNRINKLSQQKLDELYNQLNKKYKSDRVDKKLFITVYVHKRYWSLKKH